MLNHALTFLFCSLTLFLAARAPVSAQAAERPEALKGIDVTESLGRTLNFTALGSELSFVNERGANVQLSSYFRKGKPILLTLVYYECPMLCSLVLNGVLDSIKQIDWSVGQQFEIVTLSINPKDKPELALKKKQNYLSRYERTGSESGWHFLTGSEPEIQSVAAQVGFKYRYDPVEKQYLHAASIFILTPEGKLSRYLYGTAFKPQDLKLALLEASEGKVAPSTIDRVLLFCFHFDPSKNSYTFRVWRAVQIVLCIQVLVLAGLLGYLWKRDRAKTERHRL
jgi:protein SCO1/2